MTATTRTLIALSASEIDSFLAEPLFAELKAMLPDHRLVGTEDLSPDEYGRVILDYQPEIVLSAWQTPPLKEELTDQMMRFLKYNCHLCGAVRRKIPRSFIDGGLLVTNWGNVISSSVAEAALLLVLSALRRTTYWALRMHVDRQWESGEEPNDGLFGKRIGLHGFGAIAQALADLTRPFDVAIKAFSPSVPDRVFTAKGVSRAESLEELFTWSEVLVELAPNKPENHHIVSEELLRLLPAGAVFVNVGRGAVVDEQALIRIAREGMLQVGLDVYETEPLPADSPLRGMRNVTLLPHIGGPTDDRLVDCGRVALENIDRYLAGKPLENLVTASVYDRIT